MLLNDKSKSRQRFVTFSDNINLRDIIHLLYAHPLVIIQLCILFNIMLKHGTVLCLHCSLWV